MASANVRSRILGAGERSSVSLRVMMWSTHRSFFHASRERFLSARRHMSSEKGYKVESPYGTAPCGLAGVLCARGYLTFSPKLKLNITNFVRTGSHDRPRVVEAVCSKTCVAAAACFWLVRYGRGYATKGAGG